MQFPNGTPRGNCDPEFELGTGYRFPNRPLAENASRNSRSKRDALSQSRAYGKLRPTLKGKTGTQFPGRASKRSCGGIVPAWASTSKNKNYFTATNEGLAGTPKGTLQRPTSVMECRAAPIGDTLPAYQAMKLAIALDDRRDAGKVQIQRNDCHDNDHCRDQLIVQVWKHRLTAASLACNVDGDGRSKKDRCDHDALEAR